MLARPFKLTVMRVHGELNVVSVCGDEGMRMCVYLRARVCGYVVFV